MIIQLGYAFAITMWIAIYYDIIYYTLHDDVIRPDFACALITDHIRVLNCLSKYAVYIFTKMKSFKGLFTKSDTIRSSASTRSYVHDRSISTSGEAAASG